MSASSKLHRPVPTVENGRGSPATALRHIRALLARGEYQEASRAAESAASEYPGNPELERYARLLAPPVIGPSHSADAGDIAADKRWLKEHAAEFQGKVVALRDGQFLGAAPTVEALQREVGSLKGCFVTRVF